LTESKSKKKNVYQPEFIEISHPKTNKTHRFVFTTVFPFSFSFFSIEYTKDDILNSEKNRSELTKPIKFHLDPNILEKTQPQGASPSSTIINKSTKSPYKKLADSIHSENNDEDVSLPSNTITSSTSENLSKEFNTSSDKVTRQIRPGDRVKNNTKKQLNNPQSSLHEADWYRRSIEMNKDHSDDAKQIQLISDKHISQTNFDQQQAYIIKNKCSLLKLIY
jgi:hypothetical protein